MRYLQALYLCKCHTYGWQANDDGLVAFVYQIVNKFRDESGNIRWEDFKNGMEKSV